MLKREHRVNKLEFEKDLYKLKDKLQDDDYAVDLYGALCNMQWQNIKNPEIIYSCSWRYAGGVIAGMRCEGESYLDFYCSGGEGNVTEEVKEDLRKLGWQPIEYDLR